MSDIVVNRVLKLLAGLLLLPLCVAATQTLGDLVQSLQSSADALLPTPAFVLISAFLAWLLVYFTMPRPVRTYILAHELTHALWAYLMGAEVLKLNVSRDRGSVVLSKSNFLITLAPYFFPLYTVLVILSYYVLSLFLPAEDYYLVWLGLIGFTWGFHFTFTVSTLLQHQTDIQESGYVFSHTVIFTLNVLGIGLWVVIVSSATLEQMVALLTTHLCTMVEWSLDSALWATQYLQTR